MPTAEYSSAGNTFSMSRWAITLPMVARRSPAITTPPGKVAATIVVPCGARSPAWPCGTLRRAGSRSGACVDRKSANEDVPGPGRPPGGGLSSHCPPFWMNDFTKSSALVSSTSSISSRMASTSSSRDSLRSATSVSALASVPPRSRRTSRLLLFLCHTRPYPVRLWLRFKQTPGWSLPLSASESGEKRLGGFTTVEQLAHVRLAAAQRVDGRDPLQRLPPGQVEDHRVPGGGGDVLGVLLQAAATEVGAGVGRAGRASPPRSRGRRAAARSGPCRPAGGRGPSRAGCRSTGSRSAAASRRPTRGRRGRGTG